MTLGFWQLGRWKDVPVALHWSALLPFAWCLLDRQDLLATLSSVLAFLVLMAVHEMGHAVAARSRGIEVIGVRLYLLHGVCEHEAPEREEDDILIAWGGVLAQLCLLAAALLVLHAASALLPGSAPVLQPVLFVFIHANIVIAAINLFPMAPLDGHRAWRVVPLLWRAAKLRLLVREWLLRRASDARRRREIEKASHAAADELLDRLRKK
jgi:Zn-dependent protease